MGNDMFNDEQLAHAKVQAIQYDPACVDCRQDAAKSQAGTTWQCARHVRAERDWLRARLANVMAEADHDIAVLTAERNAALTLAEQRGAAYDMTWREVESLREWKDKLEAERDALRERLDKEEEKRGRQYGLRVQAEEQAKEAQAAARSVVAEAHSVLRLCAVPEQIPPFKTPLAPLAVRIMWLSEKRDEALTEVERLMTLVQNWYEGRARIGATMTFVDQRFYDSARLQRTGWPGDDADGDGGPPEE